MHDKKGGDGARSQKGQDGKRTAFAYLRQQKSALGTVCKVCQRTQNTLLRLRARLRRQGRDLLDMKVLCFSGRMFVNAVPEKTVQCPTPLAKHGAMRPSGLKMSVWIIKFEPRN